MWTVKKISQLSGKSLQFFADNSKKWSLMTGFYALVEIVQ